MAESALLARTSLGKSLAVVLANSYQTMLATQNYHWNVEGSLFVPLHDMFEAQYRELFEAIDMIAERIRVIGYYSPGSFDEFEKISTVESLRGIRDAETMVLDLIKCHEATLDSLKDVVAWAVRTTDHATEDLAIERIRTHEKIIWKLRSVVGGRAMKVTSMN